jgi:hypothetical protein
MEFLLPPVQKEAQAVYAGIMMADKLEDAKDASGIESLEPALLALIVETRHFLTRHVRFV